MALQPPLLRVSNIHLDKGKSILKNVSFELRHGEVLTLLGPSGSGKTSLLRCLNRLEAIDRGEIYLNGDETRSLKTEDLRRRVGMVFQTSALVPTTVRENIGLGPVLNGQPMAASDCKSLLQKVGLGLEYLDRKVNTLSVGEQQRVALAQVLANGPEVLLMDEPTSALDPTAVFIIERLITAIHRELNTGTLLVTHDVAQAKRFNARTLVLVAGEIIASGNIHDLTSDKDNPTLVKFFAGNM